MEQSLSIQVLVATMNQSDYITLPKSLNLQTDAIIGNQCTQIKPIEIFTHSSFRGKDILWLNFEERGVGLNRNNALMRATADILVFSDDDMTFLDGYEKTVTQVFKENPKADVVIFNIMEEIPTRRRTQKAHYTTKCGYGFARIACRRESIMKYGVFVNTNYGGGTIYSHGEDSIFLADCNRRNLKILVVPNIIAKLNESRGSTWFKGYNDKYFYDKGNLLAAMGISFPITRMFFYIIKGGFTKKSLKIAKLYYKGFCEYKRDNKLNVYKDLE